jgi:hypothetical protein
LIFPHWLEDIIEATQQWLPVALLLAFAVVLWWRSLRPAR